MEGTSSPSQQTTNSLHSSSSNDKRVEEEEVEEEEMIRLGENRFNSTKIQSPTTSNHGSMTSSTSSTTPPPLSDNYLRLVDYFIVCGLSRSIVVNHIDRPYPSEILDRFPLQNHDNAPLPSHFWMFCFPTGLMIKEQKIEPRLSVFCLTEIDGARFYASSLVYYLQIPKDRNETTKTLYKPVSINLLSRFPCYDILAKLLRYLYRCTQPEITLSLPFERIISNIIYDLPRPITGYNIQFNLPILSTTTTQPENFHYFKSNQPSFPNVDISFKYLFNCLGIQNVLKIFTLALHERKILFFSSNESLLTTACETIAYLLYPFEWPHVFIPILPNILIDFLQAPTPLIVGMHNSPKNLEIDFNDIIVINLDLQTMNIPSNIIVPNIPEKELKLLESRLSSILYPDMMNLGIAFPIPSPLESIEKQLDVNSRIRSAFLDFFLSFFHDVNKYRYLLRKYPKPITSFNTASFLMNHQNTEVCNFLTSVIETSAITSFLDQNISKNSFFYFICKLHQQQQNNNQNNQQTFYETIIKYLSSKDVLNQLDQLEIINIPTPDDSPLIGDEGSIIQQPTQFNYQNGVPQFIESRFSTRAHFSISASIIKPKIIKSINNNNNEQEKINLDNNINNSLNNIKLTTSNSNNYSLSSSSSKKKLPVLPSRKSSLSLKTMSQSTLITNQNSVVITSRNLDSDQELLKEFIEKYTEMIFDESSETPVDMEQQNLLLNLFGLAKSRLYFVESLSSKLEVAKKVSFQHGGWRLTLLVEIVKKIFNECDSSADFKTAHLLLNRIKDYYYNIGHLQQQQQEPLYNHFINQPLWKNTHFWESSFFDSVQALRKEKLTPVYNDYLFDDWELYSIDKQKQIVENEEEILFTSLSTFAYQMIKLKVSPTETSRFIARMAMLTSLNEDHAITLDELVERIYKAHTIDQSPINLINNNDTKFNKSDIKYFTSSVRRNIEIEKEGAKQIYTKLIENKRKKERSILSNSLKDTDFIQPTLNPSSSSSSSSNQSSIVEGFDLSVDKKDGYKVTTLKGSHGITCVAIHNKPKCLLSGDSVGNIMVSNYEDGEFQQKLSNHKDAVSCIGIGDYDVFASGSRDKTLRIWNYDGGAGWKCMSTLQEHTAEITCMEMKRNVILTGSYDSTMNMWDVRTNSRIKGFTGHVQHILSIAYNTDTNIAVSTSSDTTARIYDLRTLKCMRVLNGHNDWVTKALIDQNTLFTGSFDTIVKMWDINSGEAKRIFSGHAGGINCLAYNSATSTLISGSGDGFLKAWDTKTGFSTMSFKGHKDEILSILYEEDTLVTSSNDQTIRVWNVHTGGCQRVLRGHTDWIKCLTAPKHQPLNRFISGSWDSTVKIWDTETGSGNSGGGGGVQSPTISKFGNGGTGSFKKSSSLLLGSTNGNGVPIQLNRSIDQSLFKRSNSPTTTPSSTVTSTSGFKRIVNNINSRLSNSSSNGSTASDTNSSISTPSSMNDDKLLIRNNNSGHRRHNSSTNTTTTNNHSTPTELSSNSYSSNSMSSEGDRGSITSSLSSSHSSSVFFTSSSSLSSSSSSNSSWRVGSPSNLRPRSSYRDDTKG